MPVKKNLLDFCLASVQHTMIHLENKFLPPTYDGAVIHLLVTIFAFLILNHGTYCELRLESFPWRFTVSSDGEGYFI